MLGAASAVSCGASLRGLYEGDVRFEHCMALDARPDVKPTLRRACWEEWISFYTFGQTRDRIDYAHLREKQLSAASDFDEADVQGSKVLAAAVPDPTSAIAPPPMMMTAADAGTPDASPPDHEDERTAALGRCTSECEQGLESCRQTCKRTSPCERACSARLKRCTSRCEQRGQGSR